MDKKREANLRRRTVDGRALPNLGNSRSLQNGELIIEKTATKTWIEIDLRDFTQEWIVVYHGLSKTWGMYTRARFGGTILFRYIELRFCDAHRTHRIREAILDGEEIASGLLSHSYGLLP